MAKKCYVGVSGKARKIQKGYVGVNGVARKIKKAYIGVGGVARPCWAGGGLEYYGAITNLSNNYWYNPTASIGDYGLFLGTGVTTVVDAYSSSLVKSNPTELSARMDTGAATTVGDYAVVAIYTTTNAYSSALVKTTPSGMSKSRYYQSAAHVGNYALFGGGTGGGTSTYNVVDAYNTSLTRSTATALSSARRMLSGVSVGNYALFGGGYTGPKGSSNVSTVDWYDSSLTRGTATSLTVPRGRSATMTHADHGFFLAGSYNVGTNLTVDVYNASLTKVTVDRLYKEIPESAATVGNYGLAWCAASPSFGIDVYDQSLTHTLFMGNSALKDAGVVSGSAGGVSVGDYALFGSENGPVYAFTA